MIDEQLLAFCNRKKPDLASPWTEGGWRYATDGSICIRVPDPRGAVPDPEKRPNAAKLFEAFGKGGGEWKAWPADPIRVNVDVKDVFGQITRTVLCAEIGKHLIDEKYYLLIGGLSGVEWLDGGAARKTPAQFRFHTVTGEGQGLVVGMA
jgi:hypothetical protein